MNTYRKFFNPKNPAITRTKSRDWQNWPGSWDLFRIYRMLVIQHWQIFRNLCNL